jgi:hypothetical protein
MHDDNYIRNKSSRGTVIGTDRDDLARSYRHARIGPSCNESGKTVRVALDKLSTDDQAYVQSVGASPR